MNKTPRMGKASKGRKAAKRRLPAVLHAFNQVRDKLLKRAKRPRPSRLKQREWRLAAKAAEKKRLAEKESVLRKLLGIGEAA